jgi:hypothetical protein
MKRIFTLVLLTCSFCLPMVLLAQPAKREPWTSTISIKDRRKANEQPVVAKVTVSAYWMTSRVSPGLPILKGPDGNPDPVRYDLQLESYLKFKIDGIEWVDPEYDKSPEYKVIMRSIWVEMSPRLYEEKRGEFAGLSESQRRKLYITSPNMEYEPGDSMPPPIIFKIDRNNRYTFTLGFTTITPKTEKEKPWPFTFTFTVDGLLRNGPGWGVKEPEPKDTIKVVAPPPVVIKKDTVKEEPTDEIDAAVARAIEQEDAETLKELMRDYPKVKSVINARSYLGLKLRRELIDSMTYQVDILYSKFSKTRPTKDDVSIEFRLKGRVLSGAEVPYYTWRGDQLFVSPPRDSNDYELKATHRSAPENWDDIILNSVEDFINFTYYDADEAQSVHFALKGGKSPYFLHIMRRTGDDDFDMEGSIKFYGDTTFSKDFLSRAFKISEEGDFKFFVEDADQLKKTGRQIIHIIPPPPIPPFVWYASGAALFLALIIFLLIRRERRRKDDELEKLLTARGGKDPRVKRKPKPELKEFWKETAISDLSLHKNFIREVSTFIKERQKQGNNVPMIEGVILGTVLKFDFENEQYEVRLDRFRAIDPTPLNYYDDKPGMERWAAIREVAHDHRDLVKIGWVQIVNGSSMSLTSQEIRFTDEQFSELFQLYLKIDIEGKEKMCGFFTRTIGGKVNNARDRKPGVDYWLDWDKLEDAGYYETRLKGTDEDLVAESQNKEVKSNPKTA